MLTCSIECHSRAARTARTCGSGYFAPWGIFCTCVPHAYRPQPHRTYVRTACGTPGGSKDAAEELLVEVLAELKTMETADWGLMDTRETQPAAGDTKYYSGL